MRDAIRGFGAGLVVLAISLCAGLTLAAPLSLQVDRDSIAINEAVEVVVQVTGRHAVLQVPESEDFSVSDATSPFNQPIFCMSMGLEVISGPCTYRFFFAPKKDGTLTIGPFQLVDNFYRPGRLIASTKPVTIQVASEPAANPRAIPRQRTSRTRPRRPSRTPREAPSGPSIAGPEQPPTTPGALANLAEYSQHDLFLVPQTAKDIYYVNEPFTIDFILYVGDDSGASSLQGMELPELDGFRKERLENETMELGGTSIGGKHYNRYLLSSYVLIPMEPGDRLLEGVSATVLAAASNIQQFQGGFSISIRGGTQPVEVFAPPLQLKILEPPSPYPAGFSTANVGQFRIDHLVPPNPQPAGTWMVLKYELSGTGNLLSVEVPALTKDGAIEVRAPYQDNSGVTIDREGINGTLAVQLPFRLTRAGEKTLPPLTFVYFDPARKSYETLSIPLPPVVAEAPVTDDGAAPVIARDGLAPLVTSSLLVQAPSQDPWYTGRLVAMLLGIVLAIYLLLVVVRAMLRSADRDPLRRRRRAALQQARRDLDEARKHLQANRTDACFGALSRSLTGYLEGRFGLLAGSTTFDVLEQGLAQQGVPPDLSQAVRAELENADFGRFAPTTLQGGDMAASVGRIEELMARLDKVRGRSL